MTTSRPIGPVVPGWRPAMVPPSDLVLTGRLIRLVPLRADRHAAALHGAYGGAGWIWDYMPVGPFATEAEYAAWVRSTETDPATVFFAIESLADGAPVGVASYLNIAPANGSVEVGNIAFAPVLQGRPEATEAMVLMMRWAFSNGYRRYEWKCNALNLPSRRAAQRLGFSFEGVFRQHMVVKGRNRDTAWLAITDAQWPGLSQRFDAWLAPENFDGSGRQITRLSVLTSPLRVASDPAL
ncbi:GNAT family N-acetyltransferase [Pseudooceanicola algae]|uniref:Uncharacterized protein n=1 Tax=Pseudooceanicola algae TaxID=1537215 RepID=A0A418SH21_9RHOB|nr:GNAT family protein [Pseudooceanicola algae]QPM88861.1 hypothetical protein PSAL_000640 [Pseudooceanicola algae]